MTEIGIDVQMMSVERTLRRNRKMMSDDQDAADHRVLLHAVDRPLDELRLVVEHRQADARHFAVDALDLGAHAFGDLHGVLARLLGARACGCRAGR